jgi:transcriptional regulator with XRE-family HTH domain
MDRKESLGEVILLARRRADLTQEELAKRVGVSAPDVSRWERNRRRPRLAQLASVASITGDDSVLDLRGIADLGNPSSGWMWETAGQAAGY